MSTLTQQDIKNFLIRVYFGTTDAHELPLSAVERAYRDMNRTMHGIHTVQTEDNKNHLNLFVKNISSEVLITVFNQETFDDWHYKKCNELKAEFIRVFNFKISYGQAQKWLNMTLKYMFTIGTDIINGINTNYEFFHIPLDNIIQDKLERHNISKIPTRWSRIDDYHTYLQYQFKVRSTFAGQIPLDVEFRLFID